MFIPMRRATLRKAAILLVWFGLGLTSVTRVGGSGPSILRLFDSLTITEEDMAGAASEAGDRFGEELFVADTNGDGASDLFVGAPGESPGTDPPAGITFAFQGSGGSVTQGRFGLLAEADSGGTNSAGDRFGAAIASGRFDVDALADLAVGAPGEPFNALAQAGAVYIFHGNFDKPLGGVMLRQEAAGGVSEAADQFGAAIAAGDFDGNGFDDLAVGAPGETLGTAPSTGALSIIPFTSAGMVAGSTLTQESVGQVSQIGDRFAASLAVGDFNGDGLDDLAVGVPGEPTGGLAGSGAVLILSGSPAGLVFSAWVTASTAGQTVEAGDQFGGALAVGDFDGDGRDDLAVSSSARQVGSGADAGSVCLLRGVGATLVPGGCVTQETAGATAEAAAHFGFSIAAGDINADGIDDLVVGAPGSAVAGPAESGAVFVFAGAAGSLQAADLLREEDLGQVSQAIDDFGYSVAVGDFDGDGAADIGVGAPGAIGPPGIHSGRLFVFSGFAIVPRVTSGPILGAVTDSSVRVWIRADRPVTFAVEYAVSGAAWPGTTTAPIAISSLTDLTGAVPLTGLAPATTYQYRPVLNGQPQAALEHSFRTLPPLGQPGSFSFAFGADTSFDHNPFRVLGLARQRMPAFTLLMGDQIYADLPTLAANTTSAYGRRYRQNWGEPRFRDLMREVPMFMIWDDHEILDDWSEGMTGRYVTGRQAFDNYQGAHNPPPRIPGTVAFSFDVGQASFYLLDTRSFRSPESAPDNAGKTMLGSAQKTDVEQWLSTSPATFKFVVSSIPFNDHANTDGDSWEGYLTERAELFNYIRAHHICGVVMLSGDQHWTGVFRLEQVPPYVFYEFEPTPAGINPRTMTPDTTPDILFKSDVGRVYGYITVNTSSSPATLSFDAFDESDHSIYHLDLNRNDMCPDSDGDLVRDDVDCSPADATIWDRPGEVSLLWSDPTTLLWSAPATTGGVVAPRYDLLVSSSPADFTGAAVCLASDSAGLSATDAILPAVGTGRYYHVRAENACGGAIGFDSNGVELIGRPCP
jgi:phosphodiesterase/alkaline phosphatase D-like protein